MKIKFSDLKAAYDELYYNTATSKMEQATVEITIEEMDLNKGQITEVMKLSMIMPDDKSQLVREVDLFSASDNLRPTSATRKTLNKT